jgi:hypothetical protein
MDGRRAAMDVVGAPPCCGYTPGSPENLIVSPADKAESSSFFNALA